MTKQMKSIALSEQIYFVLSMNIIALPSYPKKLFVLLGQDACDVH